MNSQKMRDWIVSHVCDAEKKGVVIADIPLSPPTSFLKEVLEGENRINVLYVDAEDSKNSFFNMVAHQDTHLIASPLEKNYAAMYRTYDKYGVYTGDIYPLADKYISEIEKEVYDVDMFESTYPSPADLEWATKKLENMGEPYSHPHWFSYTKQQKELLSLVYQTEQKTRYKKITAPIYHD